MSRLTGAFRPRGARRSSPTTACAWPKCCATTASTTAPRRRAIRNKRMAVERRSTYAGELSLLFLLATLWGASYSFIKVGVETIPPLTLIAARTAIAAALLLAMLRWRGIALPRDRALWGRFFVQALLNSVVPFTLIAWAEQSVDAGIATILNSCSPIFTFLLTWAMARHQPVSRGKLFGVASGLVGICLIVGVQALSGLGTQ